MSLLMDYNDINNEFVLCVWPLERKTTIWGKIQEWSDEYIEQKNKIQPIQMDCFLRAVVFTIPSAPA